MLDLFSTPIHRCVFFVNFRVFSCLFVNFSSISSGGWDQKGTGIAACFSPLLNAPTHFSSPRFHADKLATGLTDAYQAAPCFCQADECGHVSLDQGYVLDSEGSKPEWVEWDCEWLDCECAIDFTDCQKFYGVFQEALASLEKSL